MTALAKLDARGLRDLVHGAGWAGLDEDTKALLRQRDDDQAAARRRRTVRYLPDQAGCPKILS